LTEFAKFLGRQGICGVEEDDKAFTLHGLTIVRKRYGGKMRFERRKGRKGVTRRESRRWSGNQSWAQMDAEERGETDLDETERELKRAEGEKIKLNFGAKLHQLQAKYP
jgi:DNA/RNA-binding protein KIN17